MLIATIVLLAVFALWFLGIGGGRCVHLLMQEPVGMAIPLLACLIVIAAPQMASMMAATTSGQIGPAVAALALGFQGWFWTRAALNARGGYRDSDAPIELPWQDVAAPRLTLIPSTLIGIWPFFLWLRGLVAEQGKPVENVIPTSSVPWAGIALSILFSCLLAGLAWWRRSRHRQRKQAELLHEPAPPAPQPLPACRVARLFAAGPFGSAAAWIFLALAIAGAIVAELAPGFVNLHLHALTAALLGLSCAIPPAAVMLAAWRDVAEWLLRLLGRWHPNAPRAAAADVLGALMLVLIPLGGSYIAQAAGMYDVRKQALVREDRPDLAGAIDLYRTCLGADANAPVPAIILASEGGASRSAAWTLSVMRMLDARTSGEFGRHLFAISGVSGGSLGAVAYALAQAKYLPPGTKATTAEQQLQFWHAADSSADPSGGSPAKGLVELAHADLLSSSIARMFAVDMLLGVPSRGPALEQAFERHWQLSNGLGLDAGDAGRGVVAMRKSRPCLPHLLLNGTDVASGDRLLTSTIRFESDPGPFWAAVDVIYGQNADIPAAAAVLNSARFPLISPPGRLPAPEDDRSRFRQARDLLVIDGGVFENYGARTVWELADALNRDGRLLPIVVLISNDLESDVATCANFSATEALNLQSLTAGETPGGIGVPEVLTSLLGLYNSRGGHGRGEIAVLRSRLCGTPQAADVAARDRFLHFELPAPDLRRSQSAPMSWVLEPNACRYLLGEARYGIPGQSPVNNVRQADALAVLLEAHGADAAEAEARNDARRCGGG
jgi:hypothetical protein